MAQGQWQVQPLLQAGPPTTFTPYPHGGSTGYIYVIGEDDGTGQYGIYFKVGRTEDIHARIRELQTGNPQQLYCRAYAVVSDTVAAERAAHDAVEGYKAPMAGGTEWYQVDQANFSSFCYEIAKAIQWCRIQ